MMPSAALTAGSPRSAGMGGTPPGAGHKIAGAAWPGAWTSAFGRLGRGAADEQRSCDLGLTRLLLPAPTDTGRLRPVIRCSASCSAFSATALYQAG